MSFREKAKKQIDEMADKIHELEAKKEKASAKVKAEYEKQLISLKETKKKAQIKFDQMSDATEHKWEEAMSVFSDASKSFKEGFSKISRLFD